MKNNNNNNIVAAATTTLNKGEISMTKLQTRLFENKIKEIAKIDVELSEKLAKELKTTKTLSADSKKQIVKAIYASSPAEEIDARIREEKENPCSQQHVMAALAEVREEKIAKFQREEKAIAEKRLAQLEATGNDFYREENVAAIRKEMRQLGYITAKSRKYMYKTIC
jgi:hypothetical protein